MKPKKAMLILDHALKNGYEYLHTEDGDMAVRSAIEALSRQVPKKPDEIPEMLLGYEKTTYICPTCASEFTAEWFYCPVCGQKIDWGEDDDGNSNN